MATISAAEHPKKTVNISGRHMAYVEMGEGDPIVFLHGNPTSSCLWRNVMPHLAGQGRRIAPDLIGMGDSDKLEPSGPERHTFHEHRNFLEAFLQAVEGVAYMEAIMRPLSWDEWNPAARILPDVEKPDGSDRPGQSFPPGRQPA